MSATLLDERQYRKLLDVTLTVAIRTEQECHRLLHSAAALMDKPEDEMSEEEGRFLELIGILIDEYEKHAHPLPQAKPHKTLAYLLEEKKHEAERPLDRTAQEPCFGDLERQARH